MSHQGGRNTLVCQVTFIPWAHALAFYGEHALAEATAAILNALLHYRTVSWMHRAGHAWPTTWSRRSICDHFLPLWGMLLGL